MPKSHYGAGVSAVVMGLYLALLLESGQEPKAWEYQRRKIEFVTSGDNYVNAAAITFPWARCNWGEVTALALTEAASGGGAMVKIELAKGQAVDACTQLEIPAKSVVIAGAEQQPRSTIWQLLKKEDRL